MVRDKKVAVIFHLYRQTKLYFFQVLALLSVVLTGALGRPEPARLGSVGHHDHDHDHNDASDDYYDDNPDRSYQFGFEADGYSREETADADGTVVGKYTYVDSNGKVNIY